MRKYFVFYFITIVSLLEAQITPQQIAQKAFKSTVLISINDKNQQPLSLGSGFIIGNNLIATNHHVIENGGGGFVKLIGSDRKYPITGIIEKSERRDLAILVVNGLIAPKLPFGDFNKVEVGEVVYAIGNPSGLEGTFSQGIVSGIRNIGDEKLLQITAPISPGSSGGPVVNSNGEVIGVAVATLTNGQNLNFAIPVNYLNDLYLNGNKLPKPFSDATSPNSTDSFFESLGSNVIEEVNPVLFKWTSNQYMGYYTFSIKNNLDKAIKDVICLVIFYDETDQPIETELVVINDLVPAGLAKRTKEFGRIDADEVRSLTKSTEIRILNFEILK